MKIKITSFSTYALSILCSCGHGFIHSVYRKTVNIQIGASLLALQSSPSPQSPLSLMTELTSDQIESLSFLPGQRVEVMPEEICIFTGTNVFCFDCSGASVFDSLLLPCSHLSWTRFLRPALSGSTSTGFCLLFTDSKEDAPGDQFLINKAAMSKLMAASDHFYKEDYPSSACILSGLIGLGIGLTPSGDDFLCGVLAGLILTGHEQHPFSSCLREAVASHLTDTNDISRSFLSCALEGHFSRPVKELVYASSPKEIQTSFGEVGHSSGMDTLCGILFICSLLLDKRP